MVITGLASFSNSIMCSNPLLGGNPGGISLDTLRCFLMMCPISIWMVDFCGADLFNTKHCATHSPQPCHNIISIILHETSFA